MDNWEIANTEFWASFDVAYEAIKWALKKHMPNIIPVLDKARAENKPILALDLMNLIWFELPDNKFNIIANPKGWSTFRDFLEDTPTIN